MRDGFRRNAMNRALKEHCQSRACVCRCGRSERVRCWCQDTQTAQPGAAVQSLWNHPLMLCPPPYAMPGVNTHEQHNPGLLYNFFGNRRWRQERVLLTPCSATLQNQGSSQATEMCTRIATKALTIPSASLRFSRRLRCTCRSPQTSRPESDWCLQEGGSN